jgi:hypothetical protein
MVLKHCSVGSVLGGVDVRSAWKPRRKAHSRRVANDGARESASSSRRYSRRSLCDLDCLPSNELPDIRCTSPCRSNHDIADCIDSTEKSQVCRQSFDHGSAIVTARLAAKKTMKVPHSGQNCSASKTSGNVQVDVVIRFLTANRRGPYANPQSTRQAN